MSAWDRFFRSYLNNDDHPPSSKVVQERFNALTDRMGLPKVNLTGDDLHDLLPAIEHLADRLAVVEQLLEKVNQLTPVQGKRL